MLIYIGGFTALAILGGVGVVSHNETLTAWYAGVTATIAALAAIGGIKAYTSQEVRDLRDVYREYRTQQKAEISSLKEENIELEKKLIAQNGKSHPAASSEEIIDSLRSAGCRMDTK